MVVAAGLPTVDVQAGAQALDEDLPRILAALGVGAPEELGWVRPDRLTLLVSMQGTLNGDTQDFLLRLGFQSYRKWPPSAQFVNPETRSYDFPQDQHHVPMLTSPECYTHVQYAAPSRSIQLVCCSATKEFYDAQHSVLADHQWQESWTFLVTLTAIRKAFASHYQGRFPRHG